MDAVARKLSEGESNGYMQSHGGWGLLGGRGRVLLVGVATESRGVVRGGEGRAGVTHLSIQWQRMYCVYLVYM